MRTSNTTCWSTDTFLEGHLKVCQSRQGYRFSIDAAILAFHALPGKAAAKILDLGTGCGIVPIISAFQFPDALFYGAEIQPELAAVAGLWSALAPLALSWPLSLSVAAGSRKYAISISAA